MSIIRKPECEIAKTEKSTGHCNQGEHNNSIEAKSSDVNID